jgi:hypothetical protein
MQLGQTISPHDIEEPETERPAKQARMLFDSIALNLILKNYSVFTLADFYHNFNSMGFTYEDIKKHFDRWTKHELKAGTIKQIPSCDKQYDLFQVIGVRPKEQNLSPLDRASTNTSHN